MKTEPKRTKKSYEAQAPVMNDGNFWILDRIALPKREILRRQREQGQRRGR